MASVFTWRRFKTLTPEIHLVLAGTFLIRMAYFMVWPFIAVLLYRSFDLSATRIGAMLTCASLLGAGAGLLSGYYSDRVGRRRVILLGAVLGALSFFCLAHAAQPLGYGLAICGVALGNALLESTSKALIGDKLDEAASRELAFYVRYFLINAGVALGVLLGVRLGLADTQSAFALTACVYVGYGLLLLIRLHDGKTRAYGSRSAPPGFGAACAQVVRNRLFMLLLLSNIVIAFVYANFDSSMVQYLTRAQVPHLLAVISTLVSVNAATVILGQFPILKLMERLTPRQRIVVGVILMGVSQVLFGLLRADFLGGLVLATFILSIGELIAFPTFSVEVDRQTPDDLRGTYFGAANLYTLGTALAPVLGGLCLDALGGMALYLGLALLCLLVVLSNRGAQPFLAPWPRRAEARRD